MKRRKHEDYQGFLPLFQPNDLIVPTSRQSEK